MQFIDYFQTSTFMDSASEHFLSSCRRNFDEQQNFAHESGLPLLPNDVQAWPLGIAISKGNYVKRMGVRNGIGKFESLDIPLFYRHDLDPRHRLLPGVYYSKAAQEDLGLNHASCWLVVPLAELKPVDSKGLYEVFRVNFDGCNQFISWNQNGMTYFVDAATLVEAIVTDDDPTFRLLCSPFRNLAVQIDECNKSVTIAVLSRKALRARSNDKEHSGAAEQLAIDKAVNLAYWLLDPDAFKQLLACANSISNGIALHAPRIDTKVMFALSGYVAGNKFLVQRMLPLKSTPLWPVRHSEFTVVDVEANLGRRFSIAAQESRQEGTLIFPKWSIKPLDRKEIFAVKKLVEF